MSEHILKSHDKTLLLYHLVFPVKYRRSLIGQDLGESIEAICIELSERYEIHFVEIGTDEDHVHYLVQSVPKISVTQIVTTIKSILAREIFKRYPEVKRFLWGGHFWMSGYYANTVGRYGNEIVIQEYVKGQGKKYDQIYRGQLKLFEGLS
ncbi:MAG: IS200/IS605 family transposase [Candidatus Marinimicrobia bacterium]|nr:IS200/IS605 family transposase [Candidatus Neomarinimicrobiota bacterium]